MTLDELVSLCADRVLFQSEVNEVVSSLATSRATLYDVFATTVAERFLRGSISWSVGDAAMNNLFSFVCATAGEELPFLARRVYEAFDEGEYNHAGEHDEFQGEARTRILLEAAMSGSDDAPALRAEAIIERVRATARIIAQRALNREVSPIVAARELNALRSHVGVPADDPDFLTLVSIDSETDALPLGPVRKFWAASALAKKDLEISRAEAWAMEVGEPAFRSIIRRFAGPA